jgi:DNA processing protein
LLQLRLKAANTWKFAKLGFSELAGKLTVLDEIVDENQIERELPYWLAFHKVSAGIKPRKTLKIYEALGSMKAAWEANYGELRALDLLSSEIINNFITRRQAIDPAELLESVKLSEVDVYSFYNSKYPAALREIIDPPLVLFVQGSYAVEDIPHSVAVVGTRKPSSYGRGLAKDIARGLAQNGATIISGMAVGIDSLAHWGAIECGGKTLAVLGCGVDVCYPSSNRPLYEKLCTGSHGAIISEFFPGTKPEPWRFPARNRIIAGMARALVVVEAGLTSGSLITAKLSFENNREVFAIPGRIDSPTSEGTNAIIARNQAHLMTKYQDVLTEMNWVARPESDQSEKRTMVELFGKEKEIYTAIEQEPIQFDDLVQKLGISAHELSASLTMLELAGVVTRLPGDWYERHNSSFQVHGQKIL